MKTLLIAVLAVPLLGLLPSEPFPCGSDQESRPGATVLQACSAPTVAHAREAMISRLEAQADLSRASLARLNALDASERQALGEASRNALLQSDYVVASVELWAALRASIDAQVLSAEAADDQRADALSFGGHEVASLVAGQERILLALKDVLDARQLVADDTLCGTHEVLEIDEVLELIAARPPRGQVPALLQRAPLEDTFGVLAAGAGGDWEAKGTLIQVGNALADLSVDAGRVMQVAREDAEGGDELARSLAKRSRWLHGAAAPLQEAILAYVGVAC